MQDVVRPAAVPSLPAARYACGRQLKMGEPAFVALSDVELGRKTLARVDGVLWFRHTGSIELFHSVSLAYTPNMCLSSIFIYLFALVSYRHFVAEHGCSSSHNWRMMRGSGTETCKIAQKYQLSNSSQVRPHSRQSRAAEGQNLRHKPMLLLLNM